MVDKKSAPHLDWRVQFKRATQVDDGFSSNRAFEDHGNPIWAEKKELSDGERWQGGETAAHVTTRFTVHWTAFTADLTPIDELKCEGLTYDIEGIKEVRGRRTWLEITASARTDRTNT